MGPPTDSDRAFVDIVANTFGVIVLLTLFVFIARTPFSSPDVGEVQTERQTIDFAPSKRFLFPPYSHYFLLYQGRILEIDLNAVAEALAQAPDRFEVPVSYGVFQLWDRLHLPGTTPGHTVDYLFSDVDFYRLTLNLTRAAESATGTPLYSKSPVPPCRVFSSIQPVWNALRGCIHSF